MLSASLLLGSDFRFSLRVPGVEPAPNTYRGSCSERSCHSASQKLIGSLARPIKVELAHRPVSSGLERGAELFGGALIGARSWRRRLGGAQLALYPRTLLAEDAGVSPSGDGFAGITLAQNLNSSAEVSVALARAVEAGGTLVKPGQAVFWGGYSGYFSDPDGHLWEIACSSELYAKERRGI